MKLLLLSSLLFSGVLFASDLDYDFVEVDETESINSDPIDVSGQYQRRPKSPADRLKVLRKKLERQNEEMMKKRIEHLRYKQEVQMMRQIQAQMNKVMNNLNSIK